MYTRIYILKFPKGIVDQPIICQLVKQFDVEFNILKATILPQHEGVMILELRGHKENIRKGLNYLKGLDVKAESVATSIHRDDDRCFQCGACTGICPTAALSLKRPEMAVIFDADRGYCIFHLFSPLQYIIDHLLVLIFNFSYPYMPVPDIQFIPQ